MGARQATPPTKIHPHTDIYIRTIDTHHCLSGRLWVRASQLRCTSKSVERYAGTRRSFRPVAPRKQAARSPSAEPAGAGCGILPACGRSWVGGSVGWWRGQGVDLSWAIFWPRLGEGEGGGTVVGWTLDARTSIEMRPAPLSLPAPLAARLCGLVTFESIHWIDRSI